jgi:DNA polymerase III gamma/tau subunit
VYRFKKPSQEVLKKLVLEVAKKEGTTLEPAGAELVALVGDGSFRDTLGTLQKVLITSSGAKLSEADVAKVVGAPPGKLINDFITAVAHKNIAEAIAVFHQALQEGAEPQMFILLAVARARAVLLLRYAPALKKELSEQFGEDNLSVFETLAGKEGVGLNSQTLAELITALLESSRAPVPAIPLELALYRALG